jgi:hypothetical protein
MSESIYDTDDVSKNMELNSKITEETITKSPQTKVIQLNKQSNHALKN